VLWAATNGGSSVSFAIKILAELSPPKIHLRRSIHQQPPSLCTTRVSVGNPNWVFSTAQEQEICWSDPGSLVLWLTVKKKKKSRPLVNLSMRAYTKKVHLLDILVNKVKSVRRLIKEFLTIKLTRSTISVKVGIRSQLFPQLESFCYFHQIWRASAIKGVFNPSVRPTRTFPECGKSKTTIF
jgi:hypothetical protein